MKQSPSILVVDDDLQSLTLLAGVLAGEGYRVRPADSGALALASIAIAPPSLILLDIRMPGMNGFEVCRRLKIRDATRDIPIVFLSAARELEERVEGLQMGAVDFIAKPFSRDELLARVRIHLELADLRADLERQVAARTAELRFANQRLETELAVRRHAELAAKESEQRFWLLANGAPVGIWVTGPDGALLFCNKRALTFVGCPLARMADHALTGVVHPDDLEGARSKFAAAVAGRRPFRIECRIRRANGSYRSVLHTGIPRGANGAYAGHIGTSIDITDIKHSHERMLAAQKLESLGALAAGMAHDFNNLLGVIFAASNLALSEIPPESPACSHIDRINSAATRASEVINLLIAYAGGQCTDIENLDLSAAVQEMLVLLKTSLPDKVAWKVELARNLPGIQANGNQLRQVILNLMVNASESLEKNGGVISVTTGMVAIGAGSTIQRSTGLQPGKYCRLTVSDTGCGMTPEVRARIFDPFYSTKFIGRGLGLSAVHGIVRSLGGAIHVSSATGSGSSFEVLIPCASSETGREIVRVAENSAAG